jgi:aryl-alcohol dehydrogenase-like predicted oxidoreductase
MEYRYFGTSGLAVSSVGLGTNNFGVRLDAKQSALILDQAIDIGINFIDTANVYGDGASEKLIGRALKKKRSQVLLATKASYPIGDGPNDRGASRKHILEQIDLSLHRLDTDYVDLYQVHFPDPNTPIEETLRTMDDLVRSGKVRYVGCSNFDAWQVCEALWTSRRNNLNSFISVQSPYNMLQRDIETELIPFCEEYKIGIIPYFPLARGYLTGKYRPEQPIPEGTRDARDPNDPLFPHRYRTQVNNALLRSLEAFASREDHNVGELAIAWLLGNPTVTSVISGASSPEQVLANAHAADWQLTKDQMIEINAVLDESSVNAQ